MTVFLINQEDTKTKACLVFIFVCLVCLFSLCAVFFSNDKGKKSFTCNCFLAILKANLYSIGYVREAYVPTHTFPESIYLFGLIT